MPNPVTTPSPLGYWGVIASAAAQRLTTAALWAAISAYETIQGIIRPAGLFQAVSTMRSLAVAQRTASESLMAAGNEIALDASMVSQEINARPLTEQNLSPAYNIRFKVTTLTEEGEGDMWLTIQNRGVLPPTKGDLVDLVNSAAVAASTTESALVTGATGDMTITAF